MRKKIEHMSLHHAAYAGFPVRIVDSVLRQRSQIWNEHDYFEIAFCADGAGFHKTMKEKRRYRTGTLVVMNVHEPHCWYADDTSHVAFLQFTRGFLNGLEPFLLDNAHESFMLKTFISGVTGGCRVFILPAMYAAQIKRIYDGIRGELKTKLRGYETIVRAQFLELIVRMSRALEREHSQAVRKSIAGADAAVEKVTAYVTEHYGDDLTLALLASLTPFSPGYFSKLFKKHTCYFIYEYVNEVRVREACRMLKESGASVSDIAFKTGFRNIPYFNRVFKDIIGRTPTSYQKSANTPD
ncbi:MAG: helix-turn-helix transcriptional regulator [Spirochaetes bacterium]|nr:helix-turn-helix transcriptional regulator [Spirochaetota bacterium]